MRCVREVNAGVYLTGSLCPAERSEFERHMVGCAICRTAVSDLAALPGLLGRLSLADLDQAPWRAAGADGSPDPPPAGAPPAAYLQPDGPPGEVSQPAAAERGTGDVPAAGPVPVGPGAPPAMLARLLHRAARHSRRRQMARWGLGVGVAACLVLAVLAVLAVLRPFGTTSAPLEAMRPVAGAPAVPVAGWVGLRPFQGGTRVEMRCRYLAVPGGSGSAPAAPGSGYDAATGAGGGPTGDTWESGNGTAAGPAGVHTLRLYIVGRDGHDEQVASWTAAAGDDVTAYGTSHLPPTRIARVELRTDGGVALLVYTP